METLTQERVNSRPELEAKLLHHWALDPLAASELSKGVSDVGVEHIDGLLHNIESDWDAIEKRDENREEISRIISGESDKKLIVVGPCSLDNKTKDYDKLFDYIEELQAEHPDALIALRGNGAKPRTQGKFRGLYYSTDPQDRQIQLDVYKDAFKRGIPILTEITNTNEFATLAPYLSAIWLGARDMGSTDKRSLCTATRIPVFIKNSQDGSPDTVESAIRSIGMNTEDNEGSGVDLGFLSATYLVNGMPANITVGEGNKSVGIIARGHKLENDLGPRTRKRLVLKHIGELCTLAAKLNTVVLLDGSHDVPPMLDIPKTDGDRFPKVVDILLKAARQGRIVHAERLAGLVGEVGTTVGETDKNMIINVANKKRITTHLKRLKLLSQHLALLM